MGQEETCNPCLGFSESLLTHKPHSRKRMKLLMKFLTENFFNFMRQSTQYQI